MSHRLGLGLCLRDPLPCPLWRNSAPQRQTCGSAGRYAVGADWGLSLPTYGDWGEEVPCTSKLSSKVG